MYIESIISVTNPPVNPITIGRIGGVYGVRGWVKIISFTDKIDNIFYYDPWLILFRKQWKSMQLECWKVVKNRYIAKFFGISNREMAMLLTHSDLVISRSQLPSLCNNEYYWQDIIGCTVVTIQGNNLGCIEYITETIAYDILVIKIDNNNFIKKTNCFIPFIQDKIVKCVNLIESIIVVDWDYNL